MIFGIIVFVWILGSRIVRPDEPDLNFYDSMLTRYEDDRT